MATKALVTKARQSQAQSAYNYALIITIVTPRRRSVEEKEEDADEAARGFGDRLCQTHPMSSLSFSPLVL